MVILTILVIAKYNRAILPIIAQKNAECNNEISNMKAKSKTKQKIICVNDANLLANLPSTKIFEEYYSLFLAEMLKNSERDCLA